MAVVKLNYIKRNQFATANAKVTLGYNQTRLGKDNEHIIRALFNHGGELTEEQALQIIEGKPKGYYYWRLILNPDPNTEDKDKDLDMRQLALQTMLAVEVYLKMEGQIEFMAAEHNDHTGKRHVHGIFILPRITREQFQALSYVPRDGATKEAQLQKAMRGDFLENENIRQFYRASKHAENIYSQSLVGVAGGRAIHRKIHDLTRHSCPECGVSQVMVKLRSGKLWCKSCGAVRERYAELSL